MPHLRGKVPAIYNVQVAFRADDEDKPTIGTLLAAKRLQAHMFIERIPLESVPEGEEEQKVWLRNLYVQKDQMMESFLRTGDWFKESGVRPVKGFNINRRPYTLLNVVFWNSAINCPLLYLASSWAKNFLASITLTKAGISVSVCFLLYLGFQQAAKRLIDTTRSCKGSSYGKK